MNRRLVLAILIALALIGLADSWYLSASAVAGDPLVCDLGAGLDGCNQVAQSPYSKLFGIPLSDYGIMFYAALGLLSVVLLFAPRRPLFTALVWLSVLGALMSIGFLYIQFVLIQALCVYCLISAAITFIAVPLAFKAKKEAPGLPAVVA